MSSLADLQKNFAAAVLHGEESAHGFTIEAKGRDARERLSIFRNNTYTSLTTALKAVFPVTMQLADERFFNYAAAAYISASPPREARLAVYGAGFPSFLKRFEPCRSFPVIAEMAALEWAISDALNSPEEAALPVNMLEASLQKTNDGRIKLQPSIRFVISRLPLLGLWRSHAAGQGAESVPLHRGIHRLAVMRRGQDIHFLVLDSARFALWRSLAQGEVLSLAARRAVSRDPLFNLLTELLLLFRMNLVAGVSAAQLSETTKDITP